MNDNLQAITKSDMKKLFPAMSSNVDTIRLYLIIDDLSFDPDLITEKTNLQPYKIYKKGITYKTQFGKEWISKSNCWEIRYEQKNAVYSDDAINGFIEKIIQPHVDYFTEVLKEATGIVRFVYEYYYSNNIGMNFNKDFIQLLSKLNVEVDFDLYCLHEDEISNETKEVSL
jgi:hypothetical protein